MTRWVVLAVLVVALAAGAAFLVPKVPSNAGTPMTYVVPKHNGPHGKAVLDSEPKFDFGNMAQFQDGEHTWMLKNEGEGDLFLTASVECSCTALDLPEQNMPPFVLKPGQAKPVKIVWHTKNFQDKWSRVLTIYTENDASRGELKITISGNIQPALVVFPTERSLNFPNVPSDQSQKGRAGISSPDRPDMKILSVRSTRPESIGAEAVLLTTEEKKAAGFDEKANAYKIAVEVKPSADLGVFSEEVIVETDHPLAKEARFAVSGKRVGPVNLIPETVRMNQVSSSDGGEQNLVITVRNAPETKFEVAETPENVQVKVVPTDLKAGNAAKSRQYRMIVTVLPGTSPGLISGTITLKSDHPHARNIKIPVEITVKSD